MRSRNGVSDPRPERGGAVDHRVRLHRAALFLPLLPSRSPPIHPGAGQGSFTGAADPGELRPVPVVLRGIVVLVAEPLVDGQACLRLRASGQRDLRAGRPARPDGAGVPHHGGALRGALRVGAPLRVSVGARGGLARAAGRGRADPEDPPGGRARRLRREPGAPAQHPHDPDPSGRQRDRVADALPRRAPPVSESALSRASRPRTPWWGIRWWWNAVAIWPVSGRSSECCSSPARPLVPRASPDRRCSEPASFSEPTSSPAHFRCARISRRCEADFDGALLR